METFGVSEFTQRERNRRAEHINREAWKFEHVEKPLRGRLKLASLRQKLGH